MEDNEKYEPVVCPNMVFKHTVHLAHWMRGPQTLPSLMCLFVRKSTKQKLQFAAHSLVRQFDGGQRKV